MAMAIATITTLNFHLSKGYETNNQMIQQFLEVQNQARKEVDIPPLKWDPKLATYARAYSNQRRGDCNLVHSSGPFGENIFWGQGNKWSVRDAVAQWVQEGVNYHHESNLCSSQDCTHYTQIVWRTTKNVGCAKVICNSGDTFITCEYYPHGNYVGARPY
ncbi:hypothetical protein AMTR_s00022p00231670 [Amborella trichopoda]|uniref:SCP domain-containing protein n=1 Tax=Amborella trichopoda TaxID=13333 RepID=W1PV75_AMBTC|nr:hypothetical protein AMTR_s00022p00231670 [Amborella trichopoda]